jgi:hypothetical protein
MLIYSVAAVCYFLHKFFQSVHSPFKSFIFRWSNIQKSNRVKPGERGGNSGFNLDTVVKPHRSFLTMSVDVRAIRFP